MTKKLPRKIVKRTFPEKLELDARQIYLFFAFDFLQIFDHAIRKRIISESWKFEAILWMNQDRIPSKWHIWPEGTLIKRLGCSEREKKTSLKIYLRFLWRWRNFFPTLFMLNPISSPPPNFQMKKKGSKKIITANFHVGKNVILLHDMPFFMKKKTCRNLRAFSAFFSSLSSMQIK